MWFILSSSTGQATNTLGKDKETQRLSERVRLQEVREIEKAVRTTRRKMSKSRTTTEKLPPIHPGEVLADALREGGINATSAAIAMGLPPSTLTRIIQGQRNVTAPIALRIPVTLAPLPTSGWEFRPPTILR
jgi:addiction module HigA family antidote